MLLGRDFSAMAGGLEGFFQQFVGGQYAGHQAGTLGFRASIWRPVRHISMALALLQGAGQALGAADGEHAEVDFRLAETSIIGGVDEVAHQCQFAAAAQGITGHCGDQRFAPAGNAVGAGEEVVEEHLGRSARPFP